MTPLDGGPRPEGRYVLAALDIYLPSFDVAGFELDTDLSRVTVGYWGDRWRSLQMQKLKFSWLRVA